MDMVNSMDFSEDYADPASGIWDYGRALGWLDPRRERGRPRSLDFPGHLAQGPGPRSRRGLRIPDPKNRCRRWITNRATGKSFQAQMSDDLWATARHRGRDLRPCSTRAAPWWPAVGSTRPRDLARFAMMLLNHGTVDGTQVVPVGVIDTLEAGGSVARLLQRSRAAAPMADGDWSYRAQWWIQHTPGRGGDQRDRRQRTMDLCRPQPRGGGGEAIVPTGVGGLHGRSVHAQRL